jgi:hypothetical protein
MRKMFCPDIKSGHDIFDMRGIDRGLCDFLADDPKSPVREIHASRARISMRSSISVPCFSKRIANLRSRRCRHA